MVIEDAVFHAVTTSAIGGELFVEMLRVQAHSMVSRVMEGKVFIGNGRQLVSVERCEH